MLSPGRDVSQARERLLDPRLAVPWLARARRWRPQHPRRHFDRLTKLAPDVGLAGVGMDRGRRHDVAALRLAVYARLLRFPARDAPVTGVRAVRVQAAAAGVHE